jgi:hypothetical protein
VVELVEGFNQYFLREPLKVKKLSSIGNVVKRKREFSIDN